MAPIWLPLGTRFSSIFGKLPKRLPNSPWSDLGSLLDPIWAPFSDPFWRPSNVAEVRFCYYLQHFSHLGLPQGPLKSPLFRGPLRDRSQRATNFIFLQKSFDFKTILGSPGDPLFPLFRHLFSTPFFDHFWPPRASPDRRPAPLSPPPYNHGF